MNPTNPAITHPPTEHKGKQRAFWLSTRDRLLGEVDDLERVLEIEPRTAEIRAWYREWKQGGKGVGE